MLSSSADSYIRVGLWLADSWENLYWMIEDHVATKKKSDIYNEQAIS